MTQTISYAATDITVPVKVYSSPPLRLSEHVGEADSSDHHLDIHRTLPDGTLLIAIDGAQVYEVSVHDICKAIIARHEKETLNASE